MADQVQQQTGGMSPKAKAGMTGVTCAILAAVVGCGGIGVVGILAAIAVPNFMKFQCKSMQTEAKANLRGLYIAEKSFYAENNFYTSDLVALRWAPSGNPKYVYGFYYPLEETSRGPEDHDPERSDTANEDVLAQGGYTTSKMTTLSGDPLSGEDLPEDSEVTTGAFVAAAVGDVKADSFGNLDVWLIDQDGNVTNDEDDCSY
jgi:Tfp pilus assembly protein PilE